MKLKEKVDRRKEELAIVARWTGKLNDDEGRCPKCGAALPTGSVHSKDFCDFVWALGNFQDNAVLREVKENE